MRMFAGNMLKSITSRFPMNTAQNDIEKGGSSSTDPVGGYGASGEVLPSTDIPQSQGRPGLAPRGISSADLLRTDPLAVFRTHLGIHPLTDLNSSDVRPAANMGIYQRVVLAEQQAGRQYTLFAFLINGALGLQIIIAAALTALGAGNGPHTAITAFGALNTVLAGFLTFLKGSGLPNRLKFYQNEWTKVREYIEQRERDFAIHNHGIMPLDLAAEIATIERMYEHVRKDIEANTPDSYISLSSHMGGRSAESQPSLARQFQDYASKGRDVAPSLARKFTDYADNTRTQMADLNTTARSRLAEAQHDIENRFMGARQCVEHNIQDTQRQAQSRIHDVEGDVEKRYMGARFDVEQNVRDTQRYAQSRIHDFEADADKRYTDSRRTAEQSLRDAKGQVQNTQDDLEKRYLDTRQGAERDFHDTTQQTQMRMQEMEDDAQRRIVETRHLAEQGLRDTQRQAEARIQETQNLAENRLAESTQQATSKAKEMEEKVLSAAEKVAEKVLEFTSHRHDNEGRSKT